MSENMPFVVTVNFTVIGEHVGDFRRAVIENAAVSLRDEPECLLFDVCEDASVAGSFFLYEVYTSQAAFDEHLKSPHFSYFNGKTQRWVSEKVVRTLGLISPQSKD